MGSVTPSAAATTVDGFRQAVEAGDHEAVRALLAADVRLFGPVVPQPVRGVRDAGAVLWAALSRLDGIRYIGQFGGVVDSGDGRRVETHVLRFRAGLGGNVIDGVDVIELDDDGLICMVMVLFRPLDWVSGTGFAPRRRRSRRRAEVGLPAA